MANQKIKGITVEIGGDTTELGKALKSAEDNTNDLQSELKQVNRLLKFEPDNVELLAQKQKLLNGIVDETRNKLKTLQGVEEDLAKRFKSGEIAEDQYRAFQRELIETQSKLNKYENDAKRAENATEKLGDSAEQTEDGFTIMGGALADIVSNVIQGAVNAIGDLIGSLMELSEATEEYRTMQAKLAGSADTFGYSVEYANSKYQEFYKYLGDDQMATNAITNLMGIGAETDTISKIAEGATGVWATYGDSIPIESLTESINETITAGKVTGTFADTINWSKNANEQLNKALSGNKEAQKAFNDALKEGEPVEDAFNAGLEKITDSQERADVVAKFLNDTYGESKTKYDELNGSVLEANEAELKLKETQAQLGETLAPVNNAITNLKNQALQALAPLVERIADAFMRMYNWLQENPVVMKILTAVALALSAAFTVLAGALAIQGIIAGVSKAFAFLSTTLLANPITLIIAALAGLVAGFMYLWKNCESFRNFWINLWNKIRNIIEIGCTAIGTFIVELANNVKNVFNRIRNTMSTTIQNAIDNVVSWCKQLPGRIYNAISGAIAYVSNWGSNLINTAKSKINEMISGVVSIASTIGSKIYSAIQNAIAKVKQWGTNLLNAGKQAIQKMVDGIVNIAKTLPSKFISIGRDIVEGLKSGISGAISGLYSFIKSKLSGLVDKAKDALGINSPSKVFAEVVGKAIPEGIAKGVDDNTDLAGDAVTSMTSDLAKEAELFNGATINRKLTTTFATESANAINNNNSLLSKLDNIYDRLNRLQIVLDTGTLVGETIDKIDAGLANKQLLTARGV